MQKNQSSLVLGICEGNPPAIGTHHINFLYTSSPTMKSPPAVSVLYILHDIVYTSCILYIKCSCSILYRRYTQ